MTAYSPTHVNLKNSDSRGRELVHILLISHSEYPLVVHALAIQLYHTKARFDSQGTSPRLASLLLQPALEGMSLSYQDVLSLSLVSGVWQCLSGPEWGDRVLGSTGFGEREVRVGRIFTARKEKGSMISCDYNSDAPRIKHQTVIQHSPVLNMVPPPLQPAQGPPGTTMTRARYGCEFHAVRAITEKLGA